MPVAHTDCFKKIIFTEFMVEYVELILQSRVIKSSSAVWYAWNLLGSFVNRHSLMMCDSCMFTTTWMEQIALKIILVIIICPIAIA